ncbi:MAG: hypothetical protein OER04_15050 [Cyclobacteriaceae bacterium]|nr:hypothetical protein [Cyclobacteriaceae bacterium]
MLAATAVYAQEYKVVTTVESVVPGGAGRSRIIENTQQMDSELLTTSRTKGTKSNQGDVKRKSAKIDKLNETKLLNFYSVLGINFQNIASNDAIMTSTINALAQEGWELVFVTSGVESDAGEVDRQGIFITRYIFRRN